MKLLTMLIPIFLIAEPNTLWFESYNGSGEESIGHFILSCADNGFLQVGETYDYENSTSKILIIKVNEIGALIWSREIYVGENNLGNSVIELNDGYLITGSLDQNSAIIKLDKDNGSTIFIETFDNGGTDALEHSAKIPGGLVAVGYVYAQDPFNTFYTEGDGYVMFLDNDGNENFSINLENYIDQAYRVSYHNDEVIIAGLSEDANDYKVIKLSLNGDIIWHYTYGGDNEDHCFGMDVNVDGEIFLAGHTLSGTENWDTYTVKIDNNGNMIWDRSLGNPRGFDPEFIHDESWGVKTTSDGGCVVIAGTGDEYEEYSECIGQQCSDIWNAYLIKYDSEGQLRWEKTFASNHLSQEVYDWAGEDIDLTDDGGAIIAIDNGQFGFLRVSNIQNNLSNGLKVNVSDDFILSDNYPNPFNHLTTIKYSTKKSNSVRLLIHNIKGHELRELYNGFKLQGDHSVEWDGRNNMGLNVPGGVYFYTILYSEARQTKKMIFLK